MKDNLTIKQTGITKLNSTNYRTQAVITRAVIKTKNIQNTIELLDPEAEIFVKGIGNGIEKGKAMESSKTTKSVVDCVKDIKARTVILGYCRPEALSRILYLKIARKQWKELEQVYFSIDRQ